MHLLRVQHVVDGHPPGGVERERGGTESWPPARRVPRGGRPAKNRSPGSKAIVVEDASAQASMKSAASCETSCDTQDLVNHRILERPTPAAWGQPRAVGTADSASARCRHCPRQTAFGGQTSSGGLCLLGPGGCARRPRSRSRAGPASTRPPSLPLSPGGGGGGPELGPKTATGLWPRERGWEATGV